MARGFVRGGWCRKKSWRWAVEALLRWHCFSDCAYTQVGPALMWEMKNTIRPEMVRHRSFRRGMCRSDDLTSLALWMKHGQGSQR